MCHQCCIHTLDTYTECAINAAFTHYTHTLNVLSTLHSHTSHIHWMCYQCCIHTLHTYTECAINAAFTHYTHTLNVLSTLHSHITHIHWICINETWSVLRSEKMSIPESHQWGQIIINPTFTVFLHNKSSWSSQPLLDLIGEKQKNQMYLQHCYI